MGTAVIIPALATEKVSLTSLSGLVGLWDFSDASTLYTDTSRSTPVASDGDLIAGVTDKSGLGHHQTQATPGVRPEYRVNALNGYPTSRWTGVVAALLDANFTTTAQPCSAFMVAKQTSKATNGRWFDATGSGPNRGLCGLDTSGFVQMYAGSAVIAGSVDRYNAFHIFTFVFNGASSKGYCDGVNDASGNPGSQGFGEDHRIGSDGAAGSTTGDIVLVGALDHALTQAEHNMIGHNLKARFGLSWSDV